VTTPAFLSHLRELDVVLRVEGGQLQVSAPKNALTPELRKQLAVRKSDIVSFLSDHKKSQSDIPAIEKAPRDATSSLSFAQTRLWFLEQLAPGSSAYIIPLGARLRGKLDLDLVNRSLSEIVRRHEVLRSTFPSVNGLPSLVIQPSEPISVQFSDLTELVQEERESKVLEIASAAFKEPFDLANGPLLRARLLLMNEDDYALLLTVHHSVFDEWSVGVFWREFSSLYCAFREGKPSPLPELQIQYSDFAAWQRRYMEGSGRESHLAFWRRQLEDCLPILDLPADWTRSNLPERRSATKTLTIDSKVCESLKSLSQCEGASLFMILMAAFNVLLYRLTGQNDILLGTPIAGRHRIECEEMIGFFVNTVVIRTRLTGTDAFHDLLVQVRNTTLDAHSHQDMPFEELVDALHIPRDISRTPLFQVFFNHLNVPTSGVEIPGVKIETTGDFDVGSKFDLTLYSIEVNGSLHLRALYDADLFEGQRMECLLEQYAFLLEQMCDDPSQSLDRYSLVPPSAFGRLPDPCAPLSAECFGPVHTSFVQQAIRTPERIAIGEKSSDWTYGELEKISANLAAWLRRHNIGQGDIVAVYGRRCGSFVAALIGVLRAGAAFCILDPAYPALRLIRSIRLARPKAWLQIGSAPGLPEVLESALTEMIGGCRLMVPLNQNEVAGIDLGAEFAGSVDVDPDCPAYVTFTSGTTADPKCILTSHRPLSHFVAWHVREFGLKAQDRFSMLSGLAHDPLLRDIFTPLCSGAALCIPPEEDMFSPARLASWMKHQKITVAHLTPAMARLLAGSSDEEIPPALLSQLRYVFFGGDVLSAQDLAHMKKLAPGASCVNFYGTSETPQAVGCYRTDRMPADDRTLPTRPIPIGNPIADTQLLVLNGAGTLAGPGELGEIYVRTPYLSQRYLNDELLTRERFVTNPYTGQSSDRMYRTGDLGRYGIDGILEFVGRADQQIKIRGYRIEPGEIEAALSDHPEIQDSAVVARGTGSADRQLVAYLVARGTPHLSPEDLRTYLAQRLPDYMIPVAFVVLPTLPITPNGKVDRRALVLREDVRQQAREGHVQPRDHVELVLAAIWREVLENSKVGVFDSFFELGGHSLSAARLVARMRFDLGIEIPLRSIFVHPTIARLAKQIRYDPSARKYSYTSEATRWSCLVPAQPLGTRPPFFFVGGYLSADDTLLVLSKLIPYFGYEQPVYGLRPRWTEGDGEQYASVEEAAREFLAEVRAVQPHGPYLLGGQCVSGIIAFEMAQQLMREGEEVSLLALLDTERPGVSRAFFANVRLARRRAAKIADALSDIMSPNGRPRVAMIRDLLRRWLGIAGSIQINGQQTQIPWRLLVGHRRLLYSHSVSNYPGRIALCINEWQSRVDPDLGWKGVARDGLDIYQIPGDHLAMLSQHSAVVAKVLLGCIEKVLPSSCLQEDRTEVGVI
jgi:amino acid adenylation domain-containing protein